MSRVVERTFVGLDDLISQIVKDTEGWDAVWFRGCHHSKYGLLPSSLRSDNFSIPVIGCEFKRRFRSEFKLSSDLEWLCVMQHYAVPTPLLDWTETLIVAMFFAMMPMTTDGRSPTIWALNPFDLEQLSPETEGVLPTSDNERLFKIR